MFFNSYAFIFSFLPITVIGYFLIGKYNRQWSKYWLILASFFFYGCSGLVNLPILALSLLVNFFLGRQISITRDQKTRRIIFTTGLVFNLVLLSFFKYTNFLFPLGISFYTIQQIAFLVDSFQERLEKYRFQDYALFVTFFPHIISGPVVRHDEVIPQHQDPKGHLFNIDNFSMGLFLFVLGLFKKVILADTLSSWVSDGYGSLDEIHLLTAWGTSLAYTLQLYFDFSGYTDMAIGLGLFFNIQLPQNFNSPFVAKNINDFWSRWHITLSKFIRTYIFTPLQMAMPRTGFAYTMTAMFIAMVIAGAWHGASWNYVLYGAAHGLAIVIHYNFKKKKWKLPGWLGWFITFNFVNASFVLFRTRTLKDALKMYESMLGLNGIQLPKMSVLKTLPLSDWGIRLGSHMTNDENLQLAFIIGGLLATLMMKNSLQHQQEYKPQTSWSLVLAGMFVLCVFGMNRITNFIYFNF